MMNKEAERLFQNDDKEKAVHLLVESLNENYNQLDLILQLSSYLVELGDVEQAEELLTKGLSIYEDDSNLLYNLGNVYFTAGKYEKASEIFQKLINSDFGFEAFYMISKTLDEMDNTQMATVYALTAQEMQPDDLLVNELLASILMKSSNFEEAKQYYQKALKIKEKSADYFNLAICQMNIGEEFNNSLKKSRELDADYFDKQEKKLANIQNYLKETEGKHE
ncbi:tetratricopeptide repeat protein [Lactobacillus terrae]|uniref:tetratricopeptide repeat protein n=1 Tax=Lactobacillus terrae TaxID=2269374 RepID=UPI001FE7032D|nr:tetratricopeptide repeat protein [Lactobacillus terrae]